MPGQPGCMYHQESNQERFLVLYGECLLLVEGEERRLRAWDFFHCPAGTEHVLVGAGEGPCAVLALGGRSPASTVLHSVVGVAQRHGENVTAETSSSKEAYASSPEDRAAPYREGDLPDW